MSVEIVFKTHSTSVDNERGVASGWQDCPLSMEGKRLAKEFGKHISVGRIDAVFTSDLTRAVETAVIAFNGSGIPIIHDERLRECNYGTSTGMPVSQMESERLKYIDAPFPEGESYRDVVARVRDFLNDLSRDWNEKRVVIIGHSAIRWALEVLLSGKSLEDIVSTPFIPQERWQYVLS